MIWRNYSLAIYTIVIGLFLCSPLHAEPLKWFKSSPGASLGDPIPDGGREGMGWTMSVENIIQKDDGSNNPYIESDANQQPESEVLLDSEPPSDEPNDSPSTEQTIGQQSEIAVTEKNDDLTTDELSQRILEIRKLYLDSTIKSIEYLTRLNDQLLSWETQDPEGNTTSLIHYSYNADHQPQVSYIDSNDSESAKTYVESWTAVQPDGEIIRQTYGLGEKWNIVDMDSTWKPVLSTTYNDGDMISEETWLRGQDGRLIKSSTKNENITVEKDYDVKGRVIEEREIEDGIIISTKTITWDEDNIVREEYKKGRESWHKELIWEDGEIKHETYYRRKLKVKEIEWTAPKERMETMFDSGKAMVRTYWKDDKLWKEEFLHKGSVIRTKEF